VNVEDATFHNVLSELRRGLVSCGLRDAVRRESKNRLVLDGRITTDIDELRSSLLIAEKAPSPAAIDELVDAIVLVRGLPFADRSYAWADAEGITSTLVWLVTRAIELSVEFAKSQGDESTVLDATAAGLRMLPSDEQFLELRQSVARRRTTNGGGVAQSPSQ
jgi:two-component SAPR family response regulator